MLRRMIMVNQVKKVTTDKEKVAVIREIFGSKADDVLKKCGTLAYDFMSLNTNTDICYKYYDFRYVNPTDLFNKAQKFVETSRPQDIAMYTHDQASRTTDWNARTAEVKQGVNRYMAVKKQEEKAKKAANTLSDAEKAKLSDLLKRTTGRDDMADTLIAKFGKDAYKTALASVLEPGNLSTELGVKPDGVFTSANLIKKLADKSVTVDNTKLTAFLEGAAERKNKQTSGIKKELKTQEKVAKIKSNMGENEANSIMLGEVVITAKAPDKKKAVALLDVKLAEFDASKIKLDMKIKSPAEMKYEELLAQKMAKMPDDLMGKKGAEIGLTIGELQKLGVDPKGDFQAILKSVGEKDPAAAEKLIPAEGFRDEKVVVSKELAIAAIERAQFRETSKNHSRARA